MSYISDLNDDLWLKKFSKKHNRFYYVNKITGLSKWCVPPCENVFEPRPLEWTGNSCYLDSALFAFFAGPESFINHLLDMNLD